MPVPPVLFKNVYKPDPLSVAVKAWRVWNTYETSFTEVLNFVFLGIVIVVGLFVAVFVNVKFKSACDDE